MIIVIAKADLYSFLCTLSFSPPTTELRTKSIEGWYQLITTNLKHLHILFSKEIELNTMAEKEATTKKTPTRKTLMQLQSETTVRDPAAHAKNQITELDKTAKRSLDKRSKCTLQIEQDSKELAQIEEQIQRIKHRCVEC